MYGSGIKALDDLAAELDGNSQSTFGRLNSEVSKHSSALGDVFISCPYTENLGRIFSFDLCLTLIHIMQLFKGIASEADTLLNDLQSSLYNQEDKLASYAQQQREVSIKLTIIYIT